MKPPCIIMRESTHPIVTVYILTLMNHTVHYKSKFVTMERESMGEKELYFIRHLGRIFYYASVTYLILFCFSAFRDLCIYTILYYTILYYPSIYLSIHLSIYRQGRNPILKSHYMALNQKNHHSIKSSIRN